MTNTFATQIFDQLEQEIDHLYRDKAWPQTDDLEEQEQYVFYQERDRIMFQVEQFLTNLRTNVEKC